MGGIDLRVLRGAPTPEELCALVCALRVLQAAPAPETPGAGRAPRVTRRPPDRYRSPRSWTTGGGPP